MFRCPDGQRNRSTAEGSRGTSLSRDLEGSRIEVRCAFAIPRIRGTTEALGFLCSTCTFEIEGEIPWHFGRGASTEGVSEFTQQFGASLPVDKALYAQDIAGSKAHARMLAAQGVISRGGLPTPSQAGLDAHQGAHRGGRVRLRHQQRGHPHVHRERAHRARSATRARACTRAAAATTRWRPTRACTPRSAARQLMQANLELRRALRPPGPGALRRDPAGLHAPAACPAGAVQRITCWRTCGCSRATTSAWPRRAVRRTRARSAARRLRAPPIRSTAR